MPLSYAVIGLGQMGMGYDFLCEDDSLVLTHSSAGRHHPDFQFIGGVDVDEGRRASFEQKYGLPSFSSIQQLCRETRVDVFALSVPTSHLPNTFHELLAGQPQLILCEKPIAYDYQAAETMLQSAAETSTRVAVNYVRRFIPGLQKLKQEFATKHYGAIQKVVAFYSKGLKNNGSHFVNLLQFLFGECSEFQVMNIGRSLETDCEPDVAMTFGGVKAYLLSADEQSFSYYTVRIVTERGVLDYNGGDQITFSPVTEDPVYPGYRILESTPRMEHLGTAQSQLHVLHNIADHLLRNQPLHSDGTTALKTSHVIDEIVSARHRLLENTCHPNR